MNKYLYPSYLFEINCFFSAQVQHHRDRRVCTATARELLEAHLRAEHFEGIRPILKYQFSIKVSRTVKRIQETLFMFECRDVCVVT